MSSLELFDFFYTDNGFEKTLILLHGTGADKYDLLPIAQKVAHGFNFLSLNGNVMEQGMRRFFVRTSMGVFDQDSIRTEAAKLQKFISTWVSENPKQQLSWLGYSNGANMILAMVFLHPELVQRAVLLHPMLPFVPKKMDFSDKDFLVSFGDADLMIAPQESRKVTALLKSFGAQVREVSHEGGHEVRNEEVEKVKVFLGKESNES